MTPSRHIPLQGASNFRDFGGYPTLEGRSVKWRRLFRSDHLSGLTAADHATLQAHGVRHLFDLRRDSEAATHVTNWPGPAIVRAPIFNDEHGPNTYMRIAREKAARHDAALARRIMDQMYERMVTEEAPLRAFGQIFARLAEPQVLPAVFHCAGGKDRTGVTCALILGVLGVSRQDIAEDFMLTGIYYDSEASRRQRITQVIADAPEGFWSEEALVPLFTVERSYIETALDIIEAAGGTERFLREKVGVAPGVIGALRDQLLD